MTKRYTCRTIEFWIAKGYNLAEAKKKVSELQKKSAKTISEKAKSRFSDGDVFGWWTVIGPKFTDARDVGQKKPGLMVKVKCKCGLEKFVRTSNLLRGRSSGCRGCYHRGKSNSRWSGYRDLPGTVVHRIKQSAKARNLQISVTKQFLWTLMQKQKSKCALTGTPLTWDNASLDRIDSDKGYIKGNIQWVLKEINLMKHKLSVERFKQLCESVVNFHEEKRVY